MRRLRDNITRRLTQKVLKNAAELSIIDEEQKQALFRQAVKEGLKACRTKERRINNVSHKDLDNHWDGTRNCADEAD